MAFRSLAFLGLASVAAGNHLAGPMQDRMNACMAERCPDFNTFNNAPGFNGMNISFAQFTAPFMNFNQFGFNMSYVLAVMGYKNESFTYVDTCLNTATAGSNRPAWCTETSTPVVKTAYPLQNITANFSCACQQCGASLEAIFQPAGRAVCSLVGHPLPCQTEFDACKSDAANVGSVTSTGSIATQDLTYPAIMATNVSSSDPCHPEATLMGYKVAYNLTEDCSSGATTLAGSATAKVLAECVATSRHNAYPTTLNCLNDIGGTSCGAAPPSCAPVSTGSDTGTQASGAATATFTVAVLALAVAAL